MSMSGPFHQQWQPDPLSSYAAQKSLNASAGPVYGSVICAFSSAWMPLKFSARERPLLLLARSRPVPVSNPPAGEGVAVAVCVGVGDGKVVGACACFGGDTDRDGVLLPDSLPRGLPGVLPAGE
jgi:hypothetical protein